MAGETKEPEFIITAANYSCRLEKVDFGQPGEFVEAVFSIDGKLEGRGRSRRKESALAYALEDLARQLKERAR